MPITAQLLLQIVPSAGKQAGAFASALSLAISGSYRPDYPVFRGRSIPVEASTRSSLPLDEVQQMTQNLCASVGYPMTDLYARCNALAAKRTVPYWSFGIHSRQKFVYPQTAAQLYDRANLYRAESDQQNRRSSRTPSASNDNEYLSGQHEKARDTRRAKACSTKTHVWRGCKVLGKGVGYLASDCRRFRGPPRPLFVNVTNGQVSLFSPVAKIIYPTTFLSPRRQVRDQVWSKQANANGSGFRVQYVTAPCIYLITYRKRLGGRL